jgi:hypothetical protein
MYLRMTGLLSKWNKIRSNRIYKILLLYLFYFFLCHQIIMMLPVWQIASIVCSGIQPLHNLTLLVSTDCAHDENSV